MISAVTTDQPRSPAVAAMPYARRAMRRLPLFFARAMLSASFLLTCLPCCRSMSAITPLDYATMLPTPAFSYHAAFPLRLRLR